MELHNIKGQKSKDFESISFENYCKGKDLPDLYVDKFHCCGCYACYNKCLELGFAAVSMVSDSEGFFYPVIDAERCKGCKSCIRVCQYHV